MGHPPWGSSMGFTLSTSEMGSIGPCPLDRPSTARRGGGARVFPCEVRAKHQDILPQGRLLLGRCENPTPPKG